MATDVDLHSCATLRRNRDHAKKAGKSFLQNGLVLEKDINEVTSEELMEKANVSYGEIDLLAGGPPCQAFSVFGKRLGREDPRGKLVYQYLRMLKELGPKSFVFENVYGLMTIENGEVLKELIKRLQSPSSSLNYDVKVHRLMASDFGVPQMRDRIFIIGSRIGSSVQHIERMFSKTGDVENGLLSWRTAGQALTGLSKIGSTKSYNHIGRKHSARIVERYSKMKFGERDHFTRINRLDPNRPSYTIIVGSDAGGGKGHVHPYEGREVTPRESARMQCFPDWYWFSGTSRHPIRQVGNAVPSLLAGIVGQKILTEIFDEVPNSYSSMVRELDQTHLFSKDELGYLEGDFPVDREIVRAAI